MADWDFGLGPQGWIPPSERTSAQLQIDRQFLRETPLFHQVNRGVDLPDSAMLYDIEKKATGGKLMPRIHQLSGSCVGSAGARCYGQSICGDVVLRGDVEDVKMPFPFATYGIGRKLGGMNGPGEGSYGSVQAKAIREWGMLPIDDPRVPQPQNNDGWLSWSSAIEIKWSHPSSWPVNERELAVDAAKYQIESVASCDSTLEVQQSLAQGYGVTMASEFGTNPKIVDGFLVGEWNTTWSHQMSIGSYHTHPSLGILFSIDNQWGADAHAACPFLSPLGVRGSFWVREKTLAKIIDSDAEIFSHSNTKGFPVRLFDWGNLGIG